MLTDPSRGSKTPYARSHHSAPAHNTTRAGHPLIIIMDKAQKHMLALGKKAKADGNDIAGDLLSEPMDAEDSKEYVEAMENRTKEIEAAGKTERAAMEQEVKKNELSARRDESAVTARYARLTRSSDEFELEDKEKTLKQFKIVERRRRKKFGRSNQAGHLKLKKLLKSKRKTAKFFRRRAASSSGSGRGGGGGLMGPPGDRVTFEQMEEHESEKGTRRKHFRQSVPKTN